MRWRNCIAKRSAKKALAFLIVCTILIGDFGYGLYIFNPQEASAAQSTIDADVSTLETEHLTIGSKTVFTTDQIGYTFFVDADGYCTYRKTTDGGSNWGATSTVDAQIDCTQVTVWYDKWTPGDTGDLIHIATMDTSADDIFYNNLDTANSDTLLKGINPVDVSTNSGNSIATLGAGSNLISMTKGTDGTIYVTVADATDSYVIECTTNCDLTTGWTETGTNPLDLTNDYNILAPLTNGDIMLINRDISAEDIRYKIWDNTNWSGSWTPIDINATDNTTYDGGIAVATSIATPGDLFLAYTGNNATLGTDDSLRTARYSNGSWATTTSVISSGGATRAITGVAISLNTATDDAYVAYSARTVAGTAMTGEVFWSRSTDGMATWETESGPINGSANDIYGVDMSGANDERIFTSWYASSTDDIYGDTIEDIFLGVLVSSTGSQTATIYASTSAVYVGGAFVFLDSYAAHDVTGITITENGTIDASTNIANIKLFYETDTSAPYNCASESYSGSENPFGSTDTNGFSGANGVSSFTGSSVNVSTTTALCVYPVMDILDTTASNATLEIEITDPSSDVTITSGVAGLSSAITISGATTVLNDTATLMHYHWRNDNGDETTATSKTGGTEDTGFAAFQQGTNARIRVEVSNEGSSSTPHMQYRLEYAQTTGACTSATGWTDVGAAGGDFDMYDTTNLTDGDDTTNIAVSDGGVSNENTTFLTPNTGILDTSSQTGNVSLSTTQYLELEYSITASSSATEGNTYCFRVTDSGRPIYAYNEYPRATISADVSVTATGTQIASTNLPATNFYVGGAYVITENTGSRNVTSITITASGTVNAQTDLDNIELYYDLDTSAPYDCASESYTGSESQFGSTDTDGFSSANGTSTFSGSVGISTTATMCVYTIFDTASGAQNGETIDIILENPSQNVLVSGGGSVSPTIDRDITGATSFVGAILTQMHYHWRNDNGDETTATSMTGGVEDISITNVAQTTPVRLRMQVSNEGSVTSISHAYTLEYGAKITSCSSVGSWTNVVDAGGAWDLFDSTNITEGNDTTNISVVSGGTTDENTTFLTSNAAIKDTSGFVASTTLLSTEFIETEFSVQQTIDAGYDITYCFRLSTTQAELNEYATYPELTTSPERDFEIQRGTVNFSTNSITLTAGVDYVAPSASTSAFVRITNTHYTGAGDSAAGGTQNADDVTAYIANPSNITTSFTIQRPATAIATTTRVSWEIVEFIGAPGSDNEIIVRSQGTVPYVATEVTATGTIVSGVVDDADVVVFVTGQGHPDILATNFNSGQSTSAWLSSSDQPVFARGVSGTDATVVSYAVVEFVGPNWFVQRNEHTYTNAGTTETEAITAVGSIYRTFLHSQKRVGNALTGTDEYGHEVWLSSIGYVSYFLESGATTPSEQTSVAWIVENTQTSAGAMDVTYSNGNTVNGAEPLTLSVPIGKTLTDITNASIFTNSRSAGTGTLYPRPIAGVSIASTTHYELWRSDTGATLTYRTIVVEWPTAGLALQQNYYRLYTDNNLLDPTDPWPVGGVDLGENTVLTSTDEPLGDGEKIRIRMSIRALNATFPAGIKSFKLQYGVLDTSCSAITENNWKTLGNTSSSTVWRGYNATGTIDGTQLSGNPPTAGDLNLSISDVAGSFEEINDTDVNTYSVPEGDDIEYDWLIEQNGANAETYYCFRMIESDGTIFGDYNNYPQIHTASFSPRTQNWRFYDDEINETPITALGNENVAPVDIIDGQSIKLRVTVKEIKNISRDDVRFKLQYSEYANFTIASDVVATTTCIATSTWCYADGEGDDNTKITSALLSDAQSCVGGVGDGCGTHNTSPEYMAGFRHNAGDATEYEYTIKSAAPRVNRVYYFRLYDIVQDIPVVTHTSESYPSLVTEGASLSFEMSGLASTTIVEGVTLDVDTTPTTIAYGSVPPNVNIEAAQRLTVDTNGTEGYQLFMMMDGNLISSSGSTIKQITHTNASPQGWVAGCLVSMESCFGFHTSDDTLEGGSDRFLAIDTYARVGTTTPEEVAYSSAPVDGEYTDIVFRIYIRELQGAGEYETSMRYISIPIF